MLQSSSNERERELWGDMVTAAQSSSSCHSTSQLNNEVVKPDKPFVLKEREEDDEEVKKVEGTASHLSRERLKGTGIATRRG